MFAAIMARAFARRSAQPHGVQAKKRSALLLLQGLQGQGHLAGKLSLRLRRLNERGLDPKPSALNPQTPCQIPMNIALLLTRHMGDKQKVRACKFGGPLVNTHASPKSLYASLS